ncbi:ribosomal protein S7 [Testicularia cyperi]|uniref:Ribosomal protein S7 n=1 Tax=Testicularia cyperi TaxID=1882483 RepID=A0A317XIZ2_9BASI|nr:ribosomal protein S7 [Testicularia cyperi]
MASLFRSSLTRRVASTVTGTAGSSSSSRPFSVISPRHIADNKNDASPVRAHRPRSAVGPGAPGQTSSQVHSKDENLGSSASTTLGADGSTQTAGRGKTQQDAIDSAMGVLNNMARDVAGNTSASASSSSSSITTPSAPSLESVYDSASGPIYTLTSLPGRSDTTLEFLTNLLMKDGKKAQAQRFTTRMLSILSQITNSNPLPLIQDAISRCAPLVKLQSKKQGGKSLQVPVALTQRQSTRKALTWIIEASKKRPDREIERRLAAEFLAVTEGTSTAIQKKEEQHRIATVNRANASVRI